MSIVVTLPYDPVWKALEWAKENCLSYITNQYHMNERGKFENADKIDYFFSDEKDAILFALRWS